MANDLFKTVRWADGEEIRDEDLNNAQRFTQAFLLDGILEALVPGLSQDELVSPPAQNTLGLFDISLGSESETKYAYALRGGGAYPCQGSTDDKVGFRAGVVFQKNGADTGDEATFIPYVFDGTEEVTIAANASGNPRVDLIEMQLAWEDADPEARDFEDAVTGAITSTSTDKTRRVSCTLRVTAGTPAASPAYPNLSFGWVPLAAVVVPNGYAGAAPFVYQDSATDAVIHDLRMPIGRMQRHVIRAAELYADNSAGVWPLSTRKEYVQGGASRSNVYAVCPVQGPARVFAVQFTGSGLNGGTPTLCQYKYGSGGPNLVAMNGLDNLQTVAASFVTYTQDRSMFEDDHAPAAGPIVLANSDNIGPPVWTNGRRCAVVEDDITADDYFHAVAVLVASTCDLNAQIHNFQFHIVGGL